MLLCSVVILEFTSMAVINYVLPAVTVDLLFEFLLQILVLVLQLGLGLQHSFHLSLQHLLLTGQLVHLQYQVFIHHVQSIPGETGTRTF